ncbi:MAG: hypothetical protein ACPG77_10585 [Nannocystaceae bacterium]
MRTALILMALLGCNGDTVDTADTSADTDTDTDTDTEPAVDLVGRWIVPNGEPLPGMLDQFWCADAEPGDYEDEVWEETGLPAECWEEGVGRCRHDVEFLENGTAQRHVAFEVRGPCPYDGIQRTVIGFENLGDWSLTSTDGTIDVYDVGGEQWTVEKLGALVVVRGGGHEVSMSEGSSF